MPITQQKISDTQAINLDVTGLDPAFEKVIRGLGILCEGDLLNNPSRITQALSFINDGIEHSSLSATELPSDLTTVENKISLNLKTLSDTTDQQNQLLAFLENRQNGDRAALPLNHHWLACHQALFDGNRRVFAAGWGGEAIAKAGFHCARGEFVQVDIDAPPFIDE